MRFKWFQNKLTLVIIPEANERVMRVKMSRAVLCAIALPLALMMGASVWIYASQSHHAVSARWTESRLRAQTSRLEQDLTSKNKAIEQLQNELFQLSRQASEVRSKVEEMKRLEQELLRLSPAGDASALKRNGPDSEAAGSAAVQGGMGGPAHPVTLQQVKTLAKDTHARFSTIQYEMRELKEQWMQAKQAMLEKHDQAERMPGLWPTVSRTVTSPFGYRKDPFTDKLSFHRGVDIAGKLNDPVVASAKGTAVTVGYDKFHGRHIVLEHGNGLRTWYMHLNETLVRQGDPVERGQSIGKLGSTGRSTGPHLHYEILLDGKSTNPKPYMP